MAATDTHASRVHGGMPGFASALASVAVPALAAGLCVHLFVFGPGRAWGTIPHPFIRGLAWPSILVAAVWSVVLVADVAGNVMGGALPPAWPVLGRLGHVVFAVSLAMAGCDGQGRPGAGSHAPAIPDGRAS